MEPPARRGAVIAIVAARNEADRIGATLSALTEAMAGLEIVVADDASTDSTPQIAGAAGARVVRGGRGRGKGASVTAAATATLPRFPPETPVLLCDADLGDSARYLQRLVEAVERDECDLAVASFERRVGGGFGVALGFARWTIKRLAGEETKAPISGQRALRARTLTQVLPLAAGYGLEVGLTADVVRAGGRLREYELDLEHRATHRDLAGFLHRARQLRDFARVLLSRWWSRGGREGEGSGQRPPG